VALIVGLGGGGHDRGGERAERGHGHVVRVAFAGQQFSADGRPVQIALGLGQGEAEASFAYDGSYVEDNNVPGRGPRVLVRWDAQPASNSTPGRIMVAIVGPGVAAVRAPGIGTLKVRHVNGIPAGYGAIVFDYTKFPAAATIRHIVGGIVQYQHGVAELSRVVPLTPLNAAGRATAPASTSN